MREMCYKCFRPVKACFCEKITPFATNFHFCILMHPMEAKPGHVGTGRVTQQFLKNSRLIIDKTFDENEQLQGLLKNPKYKPYILYPGEDSINLSTDKFPMQDIGDKTPLILVIDGTWPCAKSMMRDSKCLHHIPRVSFESTMVSRFTIRHQPAKFCLSTIESIYVVISELQKQGLEGSQIPAERLLWGLEEINEFQKKCALDPALQNHRRGSKPYKDPSQRRESKKWQERKICFD